VSSWSGFFGGTATSSVRLRSGVITMKMTSRTRQMSTKGVTLGCELTPLPPTAMPMTDLLPFRARGLLGHEGDLLEPGLVGLDHDLADVSVLHPLVRLDQHLLVRHPIVDLGHLRLELVPRHWLF